MQAIVAAMKRVVMTSRQRPLIGFLLYVVPLLLFVKLAREVREQETLQFDVAALQIVHSHATPWLDHIVLMATELASLPAIALIGGIIIWLCWKQGAREKILFVVMSLGGSALANIILKALFQRDRPELWQRLVTENSYSFPSGHAVASATLAVLCMVLVWQTKWRYVAVGGGLLYMALIGITRLYLGVHYPTDIVAGWLVATAWVLIAALVMRSDTVKHT